MNNKLWTDEQYAYAKECSKQSFNGIEVCKRYNEMSKKMGWPQRSISAIQAAFKNRGEHYGALLKERDQTNMKNAENEVADLLRAERAKSEELEKRLSVYSTLSAPPNPPKWLVNSSPKSQTGTPVLFISDIHYGEVVDAKQIEGCNSYDIKTANESIRNTIQKAIELTFRFMHRPSYDGIVCPIGGDMLTGNIHEELKETNEVPVLDALIRLRDQLIWGIGELHKSFGKVYIPWVVGNHSRLSEKPRAKGKVKDNYEWLLGQMLAKHFESEKDIVFEIPESTDVTFTIHNIRFLLSHGDQFRGGSGIAGFFPPLAIGQARKHRRQMAINKPFDVMMLGHFHQYIHTENLIVNGSIKGYDEYAYQLNLQYEKPRQALFIVHPKHGITYRMPILCR